VHNTVHHNLYYSPHVIRVIKYRKLSWEAAHRTLVGKPEEERPLERSRRR
jgi:hypothetical protein